MWGYIFLTLAVLARSSESAGVGAARLLCYVEEVKLESVPECTHLVYTGLHRGDKLESVLKEFRKLNPRTKVLLRVQPDDDLKSLPKSKYIQGLEIYNAHQTLNRTKVQETLESARAAISKLGGGPLFISLPGDPELLAKYYDLRSLVKVVDLTVMETHDLGKVKKMTYHPSRLSGLWDMMNTDSVVDLAIGLGIPASKIVISLPATALKFSLQNQTLSTPGSPTDEEKPQVIDQKALCALLQSGGWTLERDQDLSAPYAFKNKTWISFEDASSIDVKGKYARVRGLAGLALQQADRDADTDCGPTLKLALGKVLNQQSRAPRAVVLRSLEQEILAAPHNAHSLEALHLSPYRITQVVDSDGVIHSIREDTRTEFSCTRQGYFVHPRSCGRFYRCVKFDQLSPDYTVFEFDCPAGLAFDSRYEVCVWPGSLPHSQACPGSSEIAPVPRTRFHCPEHEGYYADPENCRWFFACLDHGAAELSAYEFRCPFGLGFDAGRLTCDWPWLVPACGDIARYEANAFRLSHAKLSGAQGFHGLTADAVNIAGHHSLSSGAAINNLVGIQGGFLTNEDSLDNNYILSQEVANQDRSHHALNGQGIGSDNFGSAAVGTFLPIQQEKQYTSGSLLLDDYRLPSKVKGVGNAKLVHNAGLAYNAANAYSAAVNSGRFESNSNYNADNSGAYVHDPTGDYAEPYKHLGSPVEPYIHDDSGYKHEYQDYGLYTDNEGKYGDDNSGKYIYNGAGQYKENVKLYNDYGNAYKGFVQTDKSGAYNANGEGKYIAGVYQTGNSGLFVNGQYGSSNKQEYITDDKIYTGASHTSGAVNVGLVGKTSLVNTGYVAQDNYKKANVGYDINHGTEQVYQQNYVVPQPAVAISHVGTDFNNHDGYEYATTPTSSGIPTTAAPFASTTAIPVIATYKTTFVPEPPKSSVTEIFGYSQPSVTYVQQAAVSVAPKQNYYAANNQEQYISKEYASASYNQQSEANSESTGYDYSKPSIKFEDGISYTTPSTIQVSTFQPTGFSHNTVHKSVSNGYEYLTPVQEEPFKKVIAYTTKPSYAQPTEATATTNNHKIVHNVQSVSYESANANDGYEQVQYVYEQPKTVVSYPTPQPTYVLTTPQPHIYTQETVHKVDVARVETNHEESGYVYNKPTVQFAEAPRQTVHVTTEKPIAIDPQYQYHEQTINQNENQNYGYEYSNPISYEKSPKPVVPEYKSYSQQTIHKVENQNNGYEYRQPQVTYQESPTPIVQVSTIQPPQYQYHEQTINQNENQNYGYEYSNPISYEKSPKPVVPEYKSYSQQTIHKVENQNNGYEYRQPQVTYQESPTPIVQVSTIQPPQYQYHEQTINQNENQNYGYEYSNPISYEQSPKPIVPEYKSYSQQTIHKVENQNNGYEYRQPQVTYQESPTPIVQVSTIQPPVIVPEYKSHSQQIVHKTEAHNAYQYVQPIKYEFIETQKPIQYSTIQSPVEVPELNTYSQQTVHIANEDSGYKYDAPKPAVVIPEYKQYQHTVVQTQNENTGYEYSKPSLQLVETPKPVVQVAQYSTISPPVIIPEAERYGQKTEHKVLHVYQPVTPTPAPEVIYQKPAVTVYENPIQQYTQKQTTTTYVQPSTIIHTESYPVVQKQQYNIQSVEHKSHVDHANQNLFIYNQPEIQANIEAVSSANGYSQANEVSHQIHHQYNRVPQHVSTAPSTESYQNQYYESPKTYNVPIQQETIIHQTPDQFDYKGVEYAQQYEIAHNSLSGHQVSFSTNHDAPKQVESFHISSFPSTTASPLYTPEIQIADKAEEYSNSGELSYSSKGYQVSTSHVYSSTPPNLPEKTENIYLSPSTTAPVVKINFKTPEYVPPVSTTYASTTSRPIVNIEYQAKEYVPRFESTYLPPSTTGKPAVEYTTREYLPPRTENTYLPPSSTSEPTVVYTSRDYLPPRTEKTYLPPKTTARPTVEYSTREYLPPSTTYRPKTSTTARVTTYKYVESTPEYKAPEYLPPNDDENSQVVNFESFGLRNNEYTEDNKLRYNPYEEKVLTSTGKIGVQRKQNIVVETAKSNLLGFGTVGPDAGLVYESGYSSTSPTPSSESYSVTPASFASTTTEEYQPRVPARRVKPKVAVVTKINDFNPFLVRKLGAVCSCQQPIVVLRGRRPSAKAVAVEYDEDYDYADREDLEFVQKSQRSRRPNKIKSVTTVTTSTFNPIIVPDDSYYQDYDESHESSKIRISDDYEIRSPIKSTTERVVQIRPRTKAVSVAPSYRTVLIDASSTASPSFSESPRYVASVEPSYDRYGSGGVRSRDETLQGTIDCQRAGLFRHPKQCNKFYACRWDKTKLRFTLHVFNCPVQLSFDPNLGACNWPSQGPSCQGDQLLMNNV